LDIIRFSDSSESAEEDSKSSSEFSENWSEGDEYFDTGDPEMIVDESLPFSIFAERCFWRVLIIVGQMLILAGLSGFESWMTIGR
jgi:hypothetical protein